MDDNSLIEEAANMCWDWQAAHIPEGPNNRNLISNACVIYDFMKTRGADVGLRTVLVVSQMDDNKVDIYFPHMVVVFKNDCGEDEFIEPTRNVGKNLKLTYFTSFDEVQSWCLNHTDCYEVYAKMMSEYTSCVKIADTINGGSLNAFRDVWCEGLSDIYKEQLQYINNLYKHNTEIRINSAFNDVGFVSIPWSSYVLGVLAEVILDIELTEDDTKCIVTLVFLSPLFPVDNECRILFSLGATSPREKIFDCIEQQLIPMYRDVRFDKLRGFITPQNKDKHLELEPTENDMCCVCLEPCITKTECSHILCLQCWGSIQKATNEQPGVIGCKCPMCRNILTQWGFG